MCLTCAFKSKPSKPRPTRRLPCSPSRCAPPTPRCSPSTPSRCACRCRLSRRAAATPLPSRSTSKSCSASPSVGANPCIRCCGPTRASTSRHSMAASSSTCGVPCTFDFNVAVTKYIYGLEAGEIPTTLLFSGTVFHAGRMGLQVAQIPWDREASYRLPVQLWKEMMDIVLSQHRVALPAARRLREALQIQGAARDSDLGTGPGAHDRPGRRGEIMNRELARKVADAVLYEGYMLYPVPPLGDQEPPALELRHSLSARLRGSSCRDRALRHAFGMSRGSRR